MGVMDDIKGFTGGAKERIGGVLGLTGKNVPKPELKPQSDKEKRMVGILQSMLQSGKDARQPWEPAWTVGFEYFINRQSPTRRKRWKADPKINYLWRNTEAMVSRLTNNNPIAGIVPTEPDAMEDSGKIQKLFDAWWDDINMRKKFADNTRTSLVIGDAFYYNYWDHDEGQPCTELVSPKCIYANSEATTIDDCTWLAHVTKMPVWKVWQYWPDSKKKITPGGTTTQESPKELDEMIPSDPTNRTPILFDMKDSTTTYRVYSQGDYFGESDSDTDLVQVVQFWVRDPARVSEPMSWDDGLPAMFPDGTPMTLDKPLYPGGRHIVLAGSRIIHDAPNPFEHGEFPYVKQSCYGIPDEFWSMSFTFNQVSPQKELNKTLAQLTENKNAMAQPRVIADRNSGFDPSMDTSKPGMVWWKNPGTVVEPVSMPALPSYVTDLISFGVNAMKELSGVSDPSVGFRGAGGPTSGVAIQTLAMQSQSQSGILESNGEDAIRRISKQWLGLARQYMEEHRFVRMVDDQGNPQMVPVTPEMIRKEWGVKIGVGSTLPVDRNLLWQQAVEALQVGLFDQEAALKWMRHPEADEILKRIMAQKKQQAEMQQQMAQMQAQMGQNDQMAQGGGEAPGGSEQDFQDLAGAGQEQQVAQ